MLWFQEYFIIIHQFCAGLNSCAVETCAKFGGNRVIDHETRACWNSNHIWIVSKTALVKRAPEPEPMLSYHQLSSQEHIWMHFKISSATWQPFCSGLNMAVWYMRNPVWLQFDGCTSLIFNQSHVFLIDVNHINWDASNFTSQSTVWWIMIETHNTEKISVLHIWLDPSCHLTGVFSAQTANNVERLVWFHAYHRKTISLS